MKVQFASQPDTAIRLQARLVDKDKLPADLEPVVRAGAAAARFTGKAGQVFEAFVERDGAVVRLAPRCLSHHSARRSEGEAG